MIHATKCGHCKRQAAFVVGGSAPTCALHLAQTVRYLTVKPTVQEVTSKPVTVAQHSGFVEDDKPSTRSRRK